MLLVALIALIGSIQFPFDYQNVCKGYGDYNAGAGFHQGMDFQSPDPDSLAYSPYPGSSNTAVSIFCHEDPTRNDWVVLLARGVTDTTGWSYHHMEDTTQNGTQYLDGTWFDETIGKIAPYPDLGSHLHVGWLDKANLIGGTFYQPGYFNPFDSLQTPPGYNDAPILTELHEIPSLVGPGLMVYEDYSLPQTYSDASVLQGVVYGIVDFAVSPASAFNGDPASDSCGVRRLSHRLLQQDPYTGSYEALSEYSWRTLFDMSGYFPDISCPRALALHWRSSGSIIFPNTTTTAIC
jgi:hypothetical protein